MSNPLKRLEQIFYQAYVGIDDQLAADVLKRNVFDPIGAIYEGVLKRLNKE